MSEEHRQQLRQPIREELEGASGLFRQSLCDELRQHLDRAELLREFDTLNRRLERVDSAVNVIRIQTAGLGQ